MVHELTNPWMLAALATMAIPLVIEWLFRRRRQRIAFPAMRYLMNPQKRRRVRLQDLVLLLVRTVVPGVLVLALARPMLRPASGPGAAPATRHAIILLDGTYSMDQSIGQTTAFEVGQSTSQDILRGLPKESTVSWVYLGRRPEVIKHRTTDHDSIHDAIGRATVSDWAGRMADGVEVAQQMLAADAAPDTINELYVISDLQRSTWSPTAGDPRDATAHLAQLAQQCSVFVLDTGGANVFNAYLTRFEPQEKITAVGMENRYEVEIEALNMPADGKLWLTLYADEERAAMEQSTAGASAERKPGKLITRELNAADFRSGRATVVLSHTFFAAGEHRLRVELEGDGLAVDNQRFYLVDVPENVELLVVDARHDAAVTADPLGAGSGYLQHALAPRTPPGFDRLTPFAVTVRRPDEILQLNLERYALVALANVGNLSDGLVSRLKQYVGDGGNLLIFVGDAVTPYEYNTKLLDAGNGLLPCELQAATGIAPDEAVARNLAAAGPEPDEDTTVPPLAQPELFHGLVYSASASHPAVSNVRHLTRQPAPASISRWMPLKLTGPQGELGRPVAYLTNRQPLICERSFGQGKVMLVGTSADASWNFLVYTSEYLVLVQELLRWMLGHPDQAVNLRMGQSFEQPVLLSSQYLLLRRPDFRKVRLAPVPQGNLWQVGYADTDRQGIYEVDASAEVMPRRRFVANLEATEGDLTRLDPALLRRHLQTAGAAYWEPDKAVRRAVESRHSFREFAWLFLWGVLALLAVETLLATRFGRRRA